MVRPTDTTFILPNFGNARIKKVFNPRILLDIVMSPPIKKEKELKIYILLL